MEIIFGAVLRVKVWHGIIRRREMGSLLREIANEYRRKQRKQLQGDIIRASVYTRDEMYDEAVKMYNTFIDQFYAYETTVYIRHGQVRPGTGVGENLYRGQRIRKSGGGFNPKLTIEFSGMNMQGGYSHNTASEVLESVMSGIRFPIREMTWSGEYRGKYFSYSGEPQRAFDIFERNFDSIAEIIFMDKWREFGWQ